MPRIVLYLMNKKGLEVLFQVVNKYSPKVVEYVVLSKDLSVEKDYYNELADFCNENEIKYFIRVEEVPKFKGYKFAIGWRWIIKDSENLIVFHDSILPKYRGFAPLVNMLINGEKEIGVTALFASEEYDRGKIISQSKMLIDYPVKIEKAIDLVSTLYAKNICHIIDMIIANKEILGVEQEELEASYSIWRDEKDYFIDWEKDSECIKRTIDALGFPYQGAKTVLNEDIIIIDEAIEVKDVIVENRKDNIGKIIFVQESYPVVICGKGLLKIIKARYESNNTILPIKKFRSRFGGI